MKDGLAAEIRVRTCTILSEIFPGAESGSVGLGVYTNFGALWN
jgi:hypothetical protein